MRCVYNGVDLGILETHYFSWESVYDDTGTDYLYSKVSFACRALVNGIASVQRLPNGPFINYGFGTPTTTLSTGGITRRSATPFVPGPIPTGVRAVDEAPRSSLRLIVPDPGAGGLSNPTNFSHQAIRYRLSIPRRPLYVFWGSGPPSAPATLFLESPQGTSVDCKNGPTPRLLSVVEAHGDANTLIVDWACDTYVNEAVNNEVRQARSLLSNRFSQSHAVGEDGYTTVTTEGVAIFRTDSTFALNESPDDARAVLFMPIPRGFVRKILYCRGRADVTGVEYGYEDTQVSVNFVAGPYVKASHISVVHQQTVTTNVDVFGTALGTYERVLSLAANRRFAKGEATRTPSPPIVPSPAAPARGARPLPSAIPTRGGFGGTGRGIRRPAAPPP